LELGVEVLGIIGIEDKIHKVTNYFVEEVLGTGIRFWMVSGDS